MSVKPCVSKSLWINCIRDMNEMLAVFLMGLALAKNACVSGSAECVADTLRVCGIKNRWIYVDCPKGTECAVKGSEIACIPRGGKKEDDKPAREVRGKKREEPTTLQDFSEDQNVDNEGVERKKDGNRRIDDESGSGREKKRKGEHRGDEADSREDDIIEKVKSRLRRDDAGKSRLRDPREREKDPVEDETRDEGREDDRDEKKEDDRNDDRDDDNDGRRNHRAQKKDNGKQGKKVRTITKTINTPRRDEGATITITRTVVQKQAPTEIKLEYTSSDVESKVKPVGPAPSSPESGLQGQSSQSPRGAGSSGSGQPTGTSPPSGMEGSKASPGGGSTSGSPPSSPNSPSSASTGGKPASSFPSGASGAPSAGPGGKPGQGSSAGASVASSGGSGSKPSASSSSGGVQGKSEQKPHQPGSAGGAKPDGQHGGGDGSKAGTGSSASSGSQPGKEAGNAGGSKPSGGSSGGTKKESSGGGVNITTDQIMQAMTKLGFSPKQEYVEAVVSRVSSKFTDMNDALMFIAQCAHESGGYQYIEEIACAGGTGCAGQYGTGAPGKSYHGRGFIQLSWPDNYKAAGEALGMGDELYNNPEKVAEDPNLGADVSIHYWETRVANAPGVKENHFGATTKAINGALECTGSNLDKSKKRYEIYKSLVETFGVSNPADESGCY